MAIEGFDSLLFRKWIFFRFDRIGKRVSQRQQTIQTLKTLCLTLSLISSLIRHLLYIQLSENGKLPLYYFDIIQSDIKNCRLKSETFQHSKQFIAEKYTESLKRLNSVNFNYWIVF